MAAFSERNMWVDPLVAEAGGVLLSDQIEYYVSAVKLIDPFHQEFLRPASYDLTVGDEYYVNDCGKHLQRGEKITIPPNGLAYIKTGESFNLPYYLVARYSLRVQQVYRGLLVDNGLHVDPGYHGPITIPVHNLTDDNRILEYGEKFLSVDFSRTTRFGPSILDEIVSEKDLVYRAGELRGFNGKKLVIFCKNPKDFMKPKGVYDLWISGESHKSSLEAMNENLTRVDDTARAADDNVRKLRTFGSLAILAVVIALFGLIISNFYWSSGKYSEALEKVEQVRGDMKLVQDHQARSQRLAKHVRELDSRVQALEERLKETAGK